jgi:hypothetical protein
MFMSIINLGQGSYGALTDQPLRRNPSMSRIETPALETATGETAEVYVRIKKLAGSVPNTFATIGAHGPAAL